MYIELAGIPGSGKTTLAESTREELLWRGIPCVTRATFFSSDHGRVYKLLWTLWRLHYLDWVSVKFLISLYSHQKIGIRRTVHTVHEYLKLCYLLAQRNHNSAHIVWDGGFVQRFANLVSAGLEDAETVASFIKHKIPVNALVIFIDVPTDVAVKRWYEREVQLKEETGAPLPQKERCAEEKENLRQRKRAQGEVFALLERSVVHTFTMDGLRSTKENVAYLCKMIEEKSV